MLCEYAWSPLLIYGAMLCENMYDWYQELKHHAKIDKVPQRETNLEYGPSLRIFFTKRLLAQLVLHP